VLQIMSKDKWDWNKKPLEEELSQNMAFVDALFEPMHSPEGDLYSAVRETLWPLLKTLHADARQRRSSGQMANASILMSRCKISTSTIQTFPAT